MKKLLTLWLLWLSTILLTACGGTSWPDAPAGEANAFWPAEDTAGYQKYDEAKVDAALAAGDDVVIFFWATRCPPCIGLNKDLVENADLIPENVSIFAADFDIDEELKKQYDVTKKHTAVYLWADGTIKLKNTSKEHKLQHVLDGIESSKE